MSDKATDKTGDDARASSPASGAQLDSGPAPPSYTEPSFPNGFVPDAHIPLSGYVDDSHALRSGVLFSVVPTAPLRPAFLPKHKNTCTYFYCVTKGLKVGIVTDLADAMAQTNGVSNAMNLKLSSHSAALEYFNEELAKGNVKICRPRRPRPTQQPRSPVLIVLTDSSGDEDHTIAASAPVGLSPTLLASPTRSDNALPPSHDQDDIAEALASLDLGTPDTTLSEASAHQQQGAHVLTLSPRKKSRRKAQVFVVFIGRVPGVYRTWPETESQVSGETCSLYLSYLTLEFARAAYAYAQAREWVHTSAAMAPRAFQRVTLLHPPLLEHLESNPTAAGVAAARWYVVYAGIQPGIYRTFVESGMNWISVPGAAQESFQICEISFDRLEVRICLSKDLHLLPFNATTDRLEPSQRTLEGVVKLFNTRNFIFDALRGISIVHEIGT
ncbi:hypothetical protein CPB85DRAFT_1257650 [Mucidula mucida]|nr:hypothetical protein CPB85DRAFT_1257650 [Mucidula mucida]